MSITINLISYWQSVQAKEVEELFWKDPDKFVQESVEISKSGFVCHSSPHLIRDDEVPLINSSFISLFV